MTRAQGRMPVVQATTARVRAGALGERRSPRRDSATDLGVVFDAAPFAMAVVSGEGAIERVNPALERLLGLDPAGAPGAGGLRGLKLHELLGIPDPHDRFAPVLSGQSRSVSFECDIMPAGLEMLGRAEAVPARLTVSSLRPGAGARAALATIEDLRPQRRAEHCAAELDGQLRHAARLCLTAELSASLAHEMGQPLAAVANYTQAALMRLTQTAKCSEEVLSHLRSAEAEARRGSRIVRNLAMFVRSRRCDLAAVDLGEVVGEIQEMIRAAAATANMPVVVRCVEGPLRIKADRVQIQQVVLNLVKNAAEAAAAGPRPDEAVVVRVWSPQAGEAEVSVRDGGQGLPAEASARLFSPFFTTKPQGMGLGLSICRSIIEAHGGRLWGENNPPPAPGATFRFRLPLTTTNQGDQSYDG